ncbi:MAG: hypothetical protein U0768_03190 [Anaerolineae bacterium]
MTLPIVSEYNDRMAQGDAAALGEELLDKMRAARLTFGDRLVCSVLRPHFIREADYSRVTQAATLILGALERLGDAIMADEGLRGLVGLTPDEEAIVAIDPGFRYPDSSGRLDAFFVPQDSLYFIEYNAESPGGLAFGEVLSDLFRAFPVMQAVAQRYSVVAFPIRAWILDLLLDIYRQWGGQARSNIAIVDWREVRTFNEFLLIQDTFEAAGYPTRIVDPRDLEYSAGRLRAGDFEIDLVYKRVVTSELLSREGLGSPLVRAVADRAVCMGNGFRAHLLLKKVLFAFLSDPQYGHLYTADQQAAIAAHIPWTRRVAAGYTEWRGQRVDLLAHVAAHRENLVLKPSGEYGGQGVVLGWETAPSKWEAALHQATQGVYVVQERVPVPQEEFPSLEDGAVRFSPRFLDLDPYTWQGTGVRGCGVRLSGSALLNVSAGGGSAVPMFVVGDQA